MRAISLVLVAALLGLGTTARAQSFAVDRGSWLVGGSAGFNSQGGGGAPRSTYVFFGPDVRYFVVPGLALGGTLSFSHASFPGEHAFFSFGAGPAATYYFGRGSRPLYPYVSGSALLTRARPGGSEVFPTTTGHELEAGTGLVFMLAKNVGLDAALFYHRYRNKTAGVSSDMSEYGAQIGVSTFVF